MDDIKAKQEVVDKIKEATSILVTVSKSPSVDELSAALGLALLIDKLDKHATAVFSGNIPPAILFLEPEKTFEQTTDSLRDFIIALDKEKADHLRLKVEGDVAKIFITPYRTTISSDDLSFSQGDFNVELVVALGVDNQAHLDAALESHGQILHDAPVITVTAGDHTSSLGGIDWHDARASSLSEMITGLGEALKDKERLMDKQIATALLTGIVAATDRFSNPRTTSASMTVAAQLMADGADQQLIAAELEKPQQGGSKAPSGAPVKVKKATGVDNMNIVHGETLAEMDARVKAEEARQASDTPEEKKHESPKKETKPENIGDVHAKADSPLLGDEPTLGGTLNATTDQAAEDSRREIDSDKNKTILTHSYVGKSGETPAMSGATAEDDDEETSVDSLAASVSESETVPEPPKEDAPVQPEEVHSAYALDPEETPEVAETPDSTAPPEPESKPEPAKESLPEPTPASATPPTPADLNLPMPPPIPDFSAMNAMSGMSPAYAQDPMPERLSDILAPDPDEQQPPAAPPAPSTPPTPPNNDPSQFKIPGQS